MKRLHAHVVFGVEVSHDMFSVVMGIGCLVFNQ